MMDMKRRYIEGVTELMVERTAEIGSIRLHFRQGTVRNVRVNGVDAKFEAADFLERIDCGKRRDAPSFYAHYRAASCAASRGELIVKLTKKMRSCKEMTVRIEYEVTRPRAGIRFVQIDSPRAFGSSVSRDYHAYTCDAPIVGGAVQSGGAGCRCWFPCVDEEESRCTFRFDVSVSKEYVVVGSGQLVDRRQSPCGKFVAFEFVVDRPIAAHMLGLAVGPFECMDDVEDGQNHARNFCLPASENNRDVSQWTHCVKDVCINAVKWTSRTLQCPYPFVSKGTTANGGHEKRDRNGDAVRGSMEATTTSRSTVVHKQVFVHGLEIPDRNQHYPRHVSPLGGTLCGAKVFASLVILPATLLHDKRHIDVERHTMLSQVYGVVRQYFGALVSAENFAHAWTIEAFVGHLVNRFVEAAIGRKEYRWRLFAMNEAIVHALLVSGRGRRSELVEGNRSDVSAGVIPSIPLCQADVASWTVSPCATGDGGCLGEGVGCGDAARSLRATMTAHMIEQRVGDRSFMNVLVDLAKTAVSSTTMSPSSDYLLQTDRLLNMFKACSRGTRAAEELTGSFCQQWIHDSGCADIIVGYLYNRKENVAEIFLEQRGTRRYRGELKIRVVERGGTQDHTWSVTDKRHAWKIRISTSVTAAGLRGVKRNRKRKVNVGESMEEIVETEMNDTPVLWIEIDPDFWWIRRLTVRQPEYMLVDQLTNVSSNQSMLSKIHALRGLSELPLPGQDYSVTAVRRIQDCLEARDVDERVRTSCVWALQTWQNLHAPLSSTTASGSGSWHGLNCLMRFQSNTDVRWVDEKLHVQSNDFRDRTLYVLKLCIPRAISHVRARDGYSPDEALKHVVKLLRENDNTNNPFDDDDYVASLVHSLANTICTNKYRKSRIGGFDEDNEDEAIEEIFRVVGFYSIKPCQHHVVSIACLRALCALEKARLKRWDVDLHKLASPVDASTGRLRDQLLRSASLSCAVELYLDPTNPDEGWRSALSWILKICSSTSETSDESETTVSSSIDPAVEDAMWQSLLRMARRIGGDRIVALHHLGNDTRELLERLWHLLTVDSSWNPRRRLYVFALYRIVFGNSTPPCFFEMFGKVPRAVSTWEQDMAALSRDCDVVVDLSRKIIDVNRRRRLEWLANAPLVAPPSVYVPRLKVLRMLDGSYRMAAVSEQIIKKVKSKRKKESLANIRKKFKNKTILFKVGKKTDEGKTKSDATLPSTNDKTGGFGRDD